VSGSTPPQAWLLPDVPLVFMAIYGVSALVAREIAVRFGGGATTVLVLGLAFGIVNEGMAVHSLFNPSWSSAGVLGSYGRWLGVNWLWTEWIVPFHAVWSISFPVFLVGELWPDTRSTRLLSNRWLIAFAAIPIPVAVVTGQIFASYTLSVLDWAGMAIALIVLGLVAVEWGPRWHRWKPITCKSPPAWAGAAVAAAFFLAGQVGTWQTPHLGPFPEVGFVLLAALFVALGMVATTFGNGPGGERAAFAAVLTGVGFYTALSPISEFAFGRIGLVPIDLAVWGCLYWLYRRRFRTPSINAPA